MKLISVAVLLIRLSSLSWFFEAGLLLTYLPNDLYGLSHLQSGYLANQREIDLVMKLVRFLIYVSIGVCFLAFSRPLAKLFTRGLEENAPKEAPADSWPPAPRSPEETGSGRR